MVGMSYQMPTNGGIIRGSGSIAYSMKVDQYLGDRDPSVHVYGICGQCIPGNGGMLPECRSDL